MEKQWCTGEDSNLRPSGYRYAPSRSVASGHQRAAGERLRSASAERVFHAFEVARKVTGAESGRTLTIPLMYVPHERGVALWPTHGDSFKKANAAEHTAKEEGKNRARLAE